MPFRRRPVRPQGPYPRRPRERFNPRVEKAIARLRHAHRCMETGRFIDAASIFRDLAKKAEDNALPRAPQLYLQAGRAQILGGDLRAGLFSLEYGLNLMIKLDQHTRFHAASQRVFHDLRELGYADQAEQMEARLSDSSAAVENNPSPEIHVNLPSACPKCGATIKPDELAWINTTRAYCDYCGSVLEGK